MRTLAFSLLLFAVSVSLFAQAHQREPLTQAQIDQIANAGGNPPERILLYIQFLDERAGGIQDLAKRPASSARSIRLSNELEDFTALMNELASNLDMYGDRKADLRPALKPLTEATARWLHILRVLAGDSGFDLARKEAIESGEDLDDQAHRLLTEQAEYFRRHKDQSGQDRLEPQ